MTETLTGKRRLRAHVNFFGKSWLVLQVEVHCEEPSIVPHVIKTSARDYWRDATVSDLTAHEASQGVARRPNVQETRLKLETFGFSLDGPKRALVLQVRTYFHEYADPGTPSSETWRDAGIDDLALKLDLTC